MARRRSYVNSLERDRSRITKAPLAPDFYNVPTALSLLSSFLRPVEDYRTFHPEGVHRRPRSLGARSDGNIVLARSSRPADVFRFNVPERMAVCIRRNMRREVLFAKHKTGAGARSPKRRRLVSDISCRR